MASIVGSDKRLRTIKAASKETGSSESFLRHLLMTGELTTFKIHRATFISLAEFEAITKQIRKPTVGL